MGVASAITAGASIAGGLLGNSAAKKSAKAQRQAIEAANQQITAQREENAGLFTDARQLLDPFAGAGVDSVNFLRDILTGGVTPDEALIQSPGFQFRQSEGEKALMRAQKARGNFLSGAAFKDAARFNQGLASEEFNNFINRLFTLSQQGQGAAGGQAQLFSNQAGLNSDLTGTIAGNMVGAGQARADGIASGNAALTQGIGGAIGVLAGQQNFLGSALGGGGGFGPAASALPLSFNSIGSI